MVKKKKLISIGEKINKKLPKFQYMGIIKLKYKDFINLKKYFKKINYPKIDFTSCYTKITDKHYKKVVKNLIASFPKNKFDIICVETTYRNQSKKGDFIIKFDSGKILSVSLKSYKKGFNSIQLCSGTWNSFLVRFFLDKNENTSPGMYVDTKCKAFRGASISKRDEYIKQNFPEDLSCKILANFHELDEIHKRRQGSLHYRQWRTKKGYATCQGCNLS